MRHQVSEPPIVLQGFLLLHVLTHFYICLSIVLKRVHLDPHPWRSLFACVGTHLCFCPCLSLIRASFLLLGRSLQAAGLLERKLVLAFFDHSTLLTSKFIQPAHKIAVHHYDILPTYTTCSACFVTRWSPGALWERFEYRLGIVFGYHSAQVPSLQVTCARD